MELTLPLVERLVLDSSAILLFKELFEVKMKSNFVYRMTAL